MNLWKPGATVAAVIERDGHHLYVREHTRQGVRVNQPAGHLEPGESLEQAVMRETLEETGWQVRPVALIGVFLARFTWPDDGTDVTYLRFAFACEPVRHLADHRLDPEIIEPVWLSPQALRACIDEHRSRLVLDTLEAHLAGASHPLSLLHTELSDVRVR
ncbi:MAG: NUDIX hydrolase [Burkholderiaceae bacterium]